MTEEERQLTLNRSVAIIGRDSLQNKLLATFIDERTGCICLVRSIDSLDGFPIAANALALLDIDSVAAEDVRTHLQALSAIAACRNIAVINAEESVTLEQIIAWPGVSGIFFRETSQENLAKGIQAIFNGECWLPRKMLSAYLKQARSRLRSPIPEASILTRKEIETLKLLTSGNSTHRIARKLNVSPHTVKTHLYNVFRKIRVSNRVQAVHWALQHIDGMDQELQIMKRLLPAEEPSVNVRPVMRSPEPPAY